MIPSDPYPDVSGTYTRDYYDHGDDLVGREVLTVTQRGERVQIHSDKTHFDEGDRVYAYDYTGRIAESYPDEAAVKIELDANPNFQPNFVAEQPRETLYLFWQEWWHGTSIRFKSDFGETVPLEWHLTDLPDALAIRLCQCAARLAQVMDPAFQCALREDMALSWSDYNQAGPPREKRATITGQGAYGFVVECMESLSFRDPSRFELYSVTIYPRGVQGAQDFLLYVRPGQLRLQVKMPVAHHAQLSELLQQHGLGEQMAVIKG